MKSDPSSRTAILSRAHPIIAAAIFVLAAALYVRTAAPTLGGAFDSEEFQHIAYDLGIAHATGYPLYLLLGKIFVTLAPIGNIAYRMNLLSALLSACTAALVYLNSFTLTRRQIASVAAAALFAMNPGVWRQAGVASVGPLSLLLVTALLYALLLWYEGRAPLSLAAFVFGLGLAHHRTIALLAPAIAVFVLLVDPKLLRRPRDMARNLFWLALPLLFYLYLPIFGSRSPSYTNTLAGFIAEISGGDAGGYLRTALPDMLQGIAGVAAYLSDSFGVLGGVLVIVGAVAAWPRKSERQIPNPQSPIANYQSAGVGDVRPATKDQTDHSPCIMLFLGLATLLFTTWGTLYAGEPDRYLVMPFTFLIYWFALGVARVENLFEMIVLRNKVVRAISFSSFILYTSSFVLALYLLLPFADRFRAADWSTFDRVYKQWDEIFTLPIPQGAVLVGNWGQLNAMRYMQNVENRRPDLLFVGTLYDPAPQTEAAQGAFAEGRAIFLAPGIALPTGTYRYALLGPLLEVRDQPQMQAPQAPVPAADTENPAAALVGWGLATALEPYAALTHIAPTRTARVTLYWRGAVASEDFVIRVSLFDPNGRLVSQKDEPPVRGLYPASQWQPGEYVSDVHNFLIPAGSPPGMYQLKMLTLDAATNQPTRAEHLLGSITIDRATDLARDQVFIAQPADINLSDRLAVWGYSKLDGVHHPGDTLTLDVVWSAREDPQTGADVAAQFALLDSAGKAVAEWQRPPLSYDPTSQWKKGEVLKAYYDLLLPRDLASGAYSLTLGVGGKPETLGTIQIAP